MHYYNIAVPIPSFKYLTYSSDQNLSPGTAVNVNVRRKKIMGVVIEETAKPKDTDFEIKPVVSVSEPLTIPKTHLDWLLWLSDYYLYPPGLVIQSSFPPLSEKIKPPPSASGASGAASASSAAGASGAAGAASAAGASGAAGAASAAGAAALPRPMEKRFDLTPAQSAALYQIAHLEAPLETPIEAHLEAPLKAHLEAP